MTTTLGQALKQWEAKNDGASAKEADTIKLCAVQPPIAKLDPKILSALSSCQTLSLSTNAIDKLPSLSGMASLRILSVGRNKWAIHSPTSFAIGFSLNYSYQYDLLK